MNQRLPQRPTDPNSADGQPPKPRGIGPLLLLMSLLAMLGFFLIFGDGFGTQPEVISTTEFESRLKKEEVVKVVQFAQDGPTSNSYKIEGEMAPGSSTAKSSKFTVNIDHHTYNGLADTYRHKVKEWRTEQTSSNLSDIFLSLLPIFLIGLMVWFFFIRRGAGSGGPGGVFNFGRSRARMFNKEEVKVRFSDVAGVDEAKAELSEIVEFLKNPQRFTRIGAKIPRGVMMFGPPGCGKTLLAKAIAGEAERPFYSISGSDFVEMFVGVGASRVRDLFKSARENAPCIVFIDEIDAVGRKRGSGVGGGNDEREQTLNAILVEMDGIGTEDGIIVVAATNRPDVLDTALLRPGRFDRQVSIDLPDSKGRSAIFHVHLAKVKASDNVDLEELGKATPGFSGADIANMINEAALATVLDNRDRVQMEDLLEARDKVRFGRQKKSRVMDANDLKVTAYHEAGHTIIQHLTPKTDPVHKVTIIPRGMALGATMSLPEKDVYSLSASRAQETLQVLFGGRIAEEIFCGEITSGASNDIERATELARSMVTKYGFSQRLGPVNYADDDPSEMSPYSLKRSAVSEATNQAIDEEVRRILDQAYAEARQIIEANRDKMEILTEALLKYETLDAKDVAWIMEGKSIDEKRATDRENAKRAEAARKLQDAEDMRRQNRQNAANGDAKSTGTEPRTA